MMVRAIRMLKRKWRNYKLRHLCMGKVKMLNRNNNYQFEIVGIDWDVHWQTELYLTVIIRDYLRYYIHNSLALGNCVIEDKGRYYEATEEDWDKWKMLVNSVADEFDELHRLYMEIEKADDSSDLQKKKVELTKKAFSDLAFIYDDLWW